MSDGPGCSGHSLFPAMPWLEAEGWRQRTGSLSMGPFPCRPSLKATHTAHTVEPGSEPWLAHSHGPGPAGGVCAGFHLLPGPPAFHRP